MKKHNRHAVDYDEPLGISKWEWIKVLGGNLALVLLVYTIAMICTLNGNDYFMLNFHSEGLQRIEDTLRGCGLFALVQFLFVAVEGMIISSFTLQRLPKWWFSLAFYLPVVLADLICWGLVGYFPGVVQFLVILATHVTILLVMKLKEGKREVLFSFLRLAIAMVVSLALSEMISILRTKIWELFQHSWSNSATFALNFEYDIALVLALLFLSLVLPLGKKKGVEPCLTEPLAGGSSPTMKNLSPKNSPIAKTDEYSPSPRIKKRLRLLKAKVIAIQTVALIVIALLPWVVGRPVEFSLVYASFCLTRVMLGFSRSLHFKSELMCVTIGAVVFWLLTYLTPSVEACLIMSFAYGAGVAIGFRLYWELHDLILYRRACKLDRYAMLYTAFKGNVSKKHIKGVMLMRGYDKQDIDLVFLYMERMKVDGIAVEMNYSKRTIETRLTNIATCLYECR